MDRIQFGNVSKRFSRLQGAKLLANWGFWRKDSSSSNWFWALDRVNLTVSETGKWLGIIGANGSGKTTLLRLIAGVTQPTSGTVIVHGRVVPLLELFAGMHPDLTGRENIYLNGIILGMRRREVYQKLDSIVEFAGINAFLDMPLKHYSLGMMMRVGFSVAVHVKAEIILVDEILGIGDAEFQTRSLERLGQLRKQGATILLVSHDLEVIRRLTEEALWLHGGRVAAHGPSGQVIQAYLKAVHEGSVLSDFPSASKEE